MTRIMQETGGRGRFKGLAIGASALALVIASPAWGQVETNQVEPDPAETPAQGLEEIRVTASRRATNLQSESRSVVAIGEAELSRNGVSDPASLARQVAGLSIAPNGANVQVFIRGVGDRTISAATDPAVALQVDGFYYPKSFSISNTFYDLERVEVLKGPQGTLYGRNASSGAINLITAKPRFEFGGFGEIELGNFEHLRATAAVTGPITEDLAVRVAGQVIKRDGYLSDGYNDEDSQAVRGQLLWRPDSLTSLLLSVSYANADTQGVASVVLPEMFDDPWVGPSDPQTRALIATINPPLVGQPQANGFQNIDTLTVTGTFEREFDWATLTVLPAYIEAELEMLTYFAVVAPTFTHTISKQTSIEARLSSPSGSSLKWVVGAFAANEDVNDQDQINQGFFAIAQFRPRLDDRTWAVFGEATVDVTARLRAVGGLRYTYEKKTQAGVTMQYGTDMFPLAEPLPGGADISGERTDEAVNFRAGIEYDLGPRSMAYANVSTGFKAGGFYPDLAPNSYRPEKLTAYQAGIKNRLFDNRLQLNVEGFYWDYKDKQESFLAAARSGGVVLTQNNAARATVYGVDVSVMALVTTNDVVSADLEYLHGRYDSYTYDAIQLDPSVPPITGCDYGDLIPGTPFGYRTIDCSGQPLIRSPEWSGRVAYERHQPLPGGSDLDFRVQTEFSTGYYLANDFTPEERNSSFHTTDAVITWNSASGILAISGFVRNIENEAIYTNASQSPLLPTVALAAIRPPRTYGARLRVNF